MAAMSDITFKIDITVSDETVHRCCQLLQLYLNDNPKKMLHVCDATNRDGKRDVILSIGDKEETENDD